jgi:hypothetical protein
MQEDVRRKHDDMSNPQSWMRTHTLDFKSGQLVPHEFAAGAPPVFQRIQANKVGNGKFEFTVPNLAHGTASAYGPTSLDTNGYMQDQIGLWDSFDNNFDGKLNMRKAVRWWERDEVVFKCIRTLCQLSNSAITWESPDDDVQALFELWHESAAPHSFRKQFFLEYYRTGMVPIFKTLIDYVPREYKDNKVPALQGGNVYARATAEQAQAAKTQEILARAKADLEEYRQAQATYRDMEERHKQGLCSKQRLEKYQQAVALKQYKWRKNQIPGKYIILNPLRIDMDGPADMVWLQQPFLNVDTLVAQSVVSPSQLQQDIVSQMPAEIVFQIRNGQNRVWLAPNVFKIVWGDKQDYERYPTPITTHAFPALEMKQELYSMDMSTIRGVKNRILLVKVGDKDYPALDPAQIAMAQKVFNQPARNMTFFWNHAITLEWIEPQLDSLKDQGKYAKWDAAIRTVFGVSAVLTGTSETAGAIGNSVMNFKGLEEEVNEAQEAYLEWLRGEVRMLKSALGIAAPIEPKFDKLNLKDEVKFMAVIMQMVMNGLLDPQTALETMRFHFPTVTKRMENAKKLRSKGLFVPTPSANNMGPDGQPLPTGGGQSKPGGKGGTSSGGKPANSPGAKNNSNRAGTSTPKKAKARLVQMGEEVGLVVDCSDLDSEQIEQISERFEIPTDHIFSAAAYEAAHGTKVSFVTPLPDLSMGEMAMALRDAISLHTRVNAKVEQDIAAARGVSTGDGKRGSYVTKDKKKQLHDAAKASILKPWLDEVAGGQPDNWEETMAEIKDEFSDMGVELQGLDVDLDVYAWAICTHRAKKAMAAKAN